MKSYTDIEQSKKLAEILPVESADMVYVGDDAYIGSMETVKNKHGIMFIFNKECVPCWSLAGLLGVLPDYTLQTNTDGTVFVVCESKKPIISGVYDNPIDACVAIIEKLHDTTISEMKNCYDV